MVALLYSREPGLSYSAVRDRLFRGADAWGPSHQFGYGKVNAYYTLVPRLSVTIQGPSRIESEGTYSWDASVSGGISPYTFNWKYCPDGGSCSDVGTSSSYSRTVWNGDPDFILVVTVTASDGQTATDDHWVDVCMDCGGQFTPPRIKASPTTPTGVAPETDSRLRARLRRPG